MMRSTYRTHAPKRFTNWVRLGIGFACCSIGADALAQDITVDTAAYAPGGTPTITAGNGGVNNCVFVPAKPPAPVVYKPDPVKNLPGGVKLSNFQIVFTPVTANGPDECTINFGIQANITVGKDPVTGDGYGLPMVMSRVKGSATIVAGQAIMVSGYVTKVPANGGATGFTNLQVPPSATLDGQVTVKNDGSFDYFQKGKSTAANNAPPNSKGTMVGTGAIKLTSQKGVGNKMTVTFDNSIDSVLCSATASSYDADCSDPNSSGGGTNNPSDSGDAPEPSWAMGILAIALLSLIALFGKRKTQA